MKKSKIIALLGAAITASSAVSTLTSCTFNKSTTKPTGDEYDKEYGIDEATYKAQKTFLCSKIRELFPQKANEEIRQINNVCSNIESLKREKNFSYSVLCFSLAEFARRAYKINLNTESTVTWSDVEDVFEKLSPSFEIYMDNSGFTDKRKQEILSIAENQFHELIHGEKGLRAQYGTDALSALIKARHSIINLFDEVDDNIALIAATNRLQEFFNDYSIEVRDEEEARLDKLESAGLKEGNEISATFMNRIFKLKDVAKDEPVEFRNDLLVGYDLRPKLQSISRNQYANRYSLNIDFSLCKNTYKATRNGKDLEKVTAHIFDFGAWKSPNLQNVKNKTFDEIRSSFKISTVNYPIYLSKDKENDVLYNTYFNPNKNAAAEQDIARQYLSFEWTEEDKKHASEGKVAFDPFYAGVKKENEELNGTDKEQYELDVTKLASSGLSVLLHDVSHTESNAHSDVVSTTRLDEIIQTGYSEIHNNSSQTNNNDEDSKEVSVLVDNFFENCSLTSTVTISNNDTHDSENKLKVHYNNTVHKNYERTLDTYVTDNFGLSKSSYLNLTQRWNELNDGVEAYSENEFKHEKTLMYINTAIQSAFLGLAIVADGIAVITMLATPIKMPWIIAILAVSGVSLALQIASFTIFMTQEFNKFKDYSDKIEDVRNSKEFKELSSMIKDAKEKYHIVKVDENNQINGHEFDVAFAEYQKNKTNWDDVKKDIDFFNNFGNKPQYQNFKNLLLEKGCEPTEYIEQHKPWEPNMPCFILTTSFDVASIICDVIAGCLAKNAPELEVPTTMKKELDDIKQMKFFERVAAIKNLRKRLKYLEQLENKLKAGGVAVLNEEEGKALFKLWTNGSRNITKDEKNLIKGFTIDAANPNGRAINRHQTDNYTFGYVLDMFNPDDAKNLKYLGKGDGTAVVEFISDGDHSFSPQFAAFMKRFGDKNGRHSYVNFYDELTGKIPSKTGREIPFKKQLLERLKSPGDTDRTYRISFGEYGEYVKVPNANPLLPANATQTLTDAFIVGNGEEFNTLKTLIEGQARKLASMPFSREMCEEMDKMIDILADAHLQDTDNLFKYFDAPGEKWANLYNHSHDELEGKVWNRWTGSIYNELLLRIQEWQQDITDICKKFPVLMYQ